MPDRIAVAGVEFIEFAADETEGEELAALLRTMGFAERGRHRNRDATLFRQGGINVVINTEREGLAHASYVVHGTSAYAMGGRVRIASAELEVTLGAPAGTTIQQSNRLAAIKSVSWAMRSH